ncbi:TonB-dependent receptor [Flavivirga jejuensis]
MHVYEQQIQSDQQRFISGVVQDSNGVPLIGVNISESITNKGAITDFNGGFSLEISENSILTFSSVGYKTMTVPFSGQETIIVTMTETVTELDNVVITAYGTSTKESFTGSAKKIKKEHLTKGGTASFESALKGRVSGLNSFTSGQPGGRSNIQIRGIGSINGNKEPLYVIDGIVINTDATLRAGDYEQGAIAYNPLSTINSNDIENVTVLKDAAAASLYGSRAANGVVLITTKKGRSDKTEIILDIQTGVSKNLTKERLINNQEFKSLWLEGQLHQYIQNNENSEFTRVYNDAALLGNYQDSARQDYESIYGTTDANSDWVDAIYRSGSTDNYNLSASGKEGKTTFYISGNYFNQEGTVIESDFKKYSGRINLENQSRDWLVLGTNLSISRSIRNSGLYDGDYAGGLNPVYLARVLPPAAKIYDENGYGGYADLPNLIEKNANPLGVIDVGVYENTEFRVRGHFFAKIDLSKNLEFSTTYGIDHQTVDETLYDNKEFGAGGGIWNGVLNRVKSEISQYTTSNILNYKTLIEKHKIELLAGGELQQSKMTSINNYGYDVLDSDLLSSSSIGTLWSWSGQAENYALLSYFSRAHYGFDSKYLVSASFRRDGSSRFGEASKWGNFWSVSGGWVLSKESFINSEFINYLKLRSSYGTNGNLPSQNYAALAFFDSDGKGYGGSSGLSYGQLQNTDLSWEFSKSFNVGLDATLFSNIDITVEYFSKHTEDLLMNVPVSGTAGFTEQLQNFGAMKNEGWELELAATPIIFQNFLWNTSLNLTFLENKITKLKSDIISSYSSGNGQNPIIIKEGESLNSFYLRDYAGVDKTNGMAQYYVLENGVRTGVITTDATQAGFGVFGNAIPDVQGGFHNQLTYKSFDLSFLFTFGLGANAYDYTAFKRDDDGFSPQFTNTTAQLSPWNPNNVNSNVPIRINGNNSFSNDVSTRHLYSADYLKLKNVRLNYKLPVSAKFIEDTTIYLQGENLFLLTELDGFDPEAVSNGVNFFQVPTATSVTLGVQVKL